MHYTIFSYDNISGKSGAFGFSTPGFATTPVFDSLTEFYAWCKANRVQITHSLYGMI